ncbi:pentapeptide repeat-containing protein, partial [Thiolapillus sp.]|uniref:pentapeptide repeat-containing protein n=2 Tax=Thiolapillus sp. TaxID=2017437 RepID=UPI0025DE7D4E
MKQVESPSIRGADLCGVDLREMQAGNLDMRDCHLRRTDLRGLDLSDTLLDGASIGGAKISGTLFPRSLSPEEITLSLPSARHPYARFCELSVIYIGAGLIFARCWRCQQYLDVAGVPERIVLNCEPGIFQNGLSLVA